MWKLFQKPFQISYKVRHLLCTNYILCGNLFVIFEIFMNYFLVHLDSIFTFFSFICNIFNCVHFSFFTSIKFVYAQNFMSFLLGWGTIKGFKERRLLENNIDL